MASALPSAGGPQCMRCIRRVARGAHDVWLSSTRQPVRGKKKLAKISTIKVRLLADIPRYGRQGAIIPIAAGRMRNEFYPKRMAEYMTTNQLREVGLLDAVLERDFTFGSGSRAVPEQEAKETESPVSVEVDLLKPERAVKLLTMLLPPNLDFFRTPISTTVPLPQRHSQSIPVTSAISIAAQEGSLQGIPQKTSIYGSVTTADIAENLGAILAEDSDGARVVLTAEDIKFVEEGEEKDRVKHLGIFEIDIRVKGATDDIRRTIKVNAQE